MLNISVIVIIIAVGLFLLAAALILLGKKRRIMLRQKSHDNYVVNGSGTNRGATDDQSEIGESGFTSPSYPPAAYTPPAGTTRQDGYFSGQGGAVDDPDTRRG